MRLQEVRGRLIVFVLLLTLSPPARAQQTPCGDLNEVVARVNAPECFERLAGPGTYKEYQDKQTIVPDSPWQSRLDRIAETLNRAAPAGSGQRFRILVLRVPEVNAFSVPGGDIYVNQGMLDFIASDDELQGMLCHEAAHALQHHMAQKIRDLIGAQRAARTLARYLNQRGDSFDFPAYFVTQRFSREFEEEADLRGSDLCAAGGYDPWGMVTLLRRSPGTTDAFEFASTHPTNVHRVEALIAHFKAEPATFGRWSDPASAPPSAAPTPGAGPPAFVDAYIEAYRSHRFLLMLFHGRGVNADQVRASLDELQRDPALASYLVFGDGDVEQDSTAYSYASRFGIAKLPTVSLLIPLREVVKEVGRIEGYHTAADLRGRVVRSMCDASGRHDPGAPPLAGIYRVLCDGQ